MKNMVKCLNFEFKYLGKSLAGFLGIYFGIYLLIIVFIFNLIRSDDATGSFNTSFYVAGAVYIFAFVSSSYKQLFNNLLLFGNTRNSIIISSAIAYIVQSVVLSAVSVVSMGLDRWVSGAGGDKIVDLLDLLYSSNNGPFAELIWFIAFFIMLSAFSMLFGALAYKFGKAFIVAFWVGAGFLLMILPLLYDLKYIINALGTYFCVGSAAGIYLAPVNFLITTVVLGIGAWIASRRQPQIA